MQYQINRTKLEIKMKPTNKKRKRKNKISVGQRHRDILIESFDCSVQSIENALNYVTDSDLAREIRTKAKELLKEEVKKLKIELDE